MTDAARTQPDSVVRFHDELISRERDNWRNLPGEALSQYVWQRWYRQGMLTSARQLASGGTTASEDELVHALGGTRATAARVAEAARAADVLRSGPDGGFDWSLPPRLRCAIPELDPLPARPELGQLPCTAESRQAVAGLVLSDLPWGGEVLLLGDDDLIAPVLAASGLAVTVLDADDRLAALIDGSARFVRGDVRSVPADLRGRFDAVLLDPADNSTALAAWLEAAAATLSPQSGARMYLAIAPARLGHRWAAFVADASRHGLVPCGHLSRCKKYVDDAGLAAVTDCWVFERMPLPAFLPHPYLGIETFSEPMTQPVSFRLRDNRALAVLAGVQGLLALSFYVPVSALFLTSRGLSYADIFLLETVLLAAILVAEIPTGAIADRLDRKVVLIAGFGLATVGEILFAAGGGFPVYLVSFTLHGLSIAVLSGALEAYVYELLGPRADEISASAFGRMSAIELVAGVVAAAAGSLLATIDIGLPALLAAAAHGAALVVAFFLPPHKPVPEEDEPRGEVLLAFRTMLSQPALLYGAFAAGTGFVIFNAVYTLNQPLFTDARIPLAWFGAIVGTGLLLAALANNMIGLIESRIGRGRLLVLATLGGAAGYALMTVAHPVVAVLGFTLIVLGMNLRGPILGAIANRLIDDSQRATVLSVMSTTGSLAGMAVNPALGWLAEMSASAAAYATGVLLLALGLGWIPIASRFLTEPGDADSGAVADLLETGETTPAPSTPGH